MKKENFSNWDRITLNDKQYSFKCISVFERKVYDENNPSMQLILRIFCHDTNKWIKWNDFKYSYLSEKIMDYIRNTINGQRTLYFDANKPVNFE